MQQSLTAVDKDRRVAYRDSFRQYLEDNPTVIHDIWFTDETHFHLNGFYKFTEYVCTGHRVMETSLRHQK
jgi:hypothetical protein